VISLSLASRGFQYHCYVTQRILFLFCGGDSFDLCTCDSQFPVVSFVPPFRISQLFLFVQRISCKKRVFSGASFRVIFISISCWVERASCNHRKRHANFSVLFTFFCSLYILKCDRLWIHFRKQQFIFQHSEHIKRQRTVFFSIQSVSVVLCGQRPSSSQ
jgi:hypothetical protein